jgi:energy-coupling factor transporter ATP-binding protein EcfA2
MRLQRLVLENVCQYRHLEHTWHRGLNGIVGPNGSGKSNAIKAIRFAVTGQFDNAGTKAENICQLAGDKDRSRVVLDFEHDGVDVEIVRILRRGVTSCRIGGGRPIDGDTAVTEAIMDLLAVDQRVCSEYIFVPQRRMAAFIDETPGERNKTFGQLFDLAKAEAVYKILDGEIRRVNAAPPDPEIGPMRARVAGLRARRDELTAAISSARITLEQLDPKGSRALVDRDDKWRRDRKTADDLGRQVADLATDLEARRQDLDAAAAERADLAAAITLGVADIAAARGALAEWEAAELRRGRVAELRARQADLVAEATAHPEPVPPAGPDGETTQVRIDELGHAVSTREELLAWFKDEPKVCPTCGAETGAIRERAVRYTNDLPGLRRALAEARGLQAAHVAYGRDHARWEQWARGHAEQSRRLALLLGDQDRPEDDNGEARAVDPAVCREVIDAGETLERAIADADIRIDQIRQEVNRWAGKLDSVSTKHVRLVESLGPEPDERAVAQARKDLEHADPLAQLIARHEGEMVAVARGLAADEAMLERLEEAERNAETDRLWVYHLGEVRKVMHHDRLPKVVAHNYLEILAEDTNELLESFDADFRVALADGLNFTATFLRGPYAGTISPAQRLSEGQKVLLALAFRVAVNSLFAGTAGLLCLDEPTESLDERNLACLEVAIGRMRDLSESRGLQCLLVTHEPSFEVLFDGVLRLAS